MKDVDQLLGIVATFAAVTVLAGLYTRSMVIRYKTGSIGGDSGGVYPYALGNRLRYIYTAGTFNGIDIILPATLPNIFLYGKAHQRTAGPRHYLPKNQRIELEGNFGRYFTCYVPNGYQVLALSLLAPDVMQTLLATVPDCEVEFYRDRVRIIVRHRVYGRAEAETRLLEAAERLMQEVDHRLRSWTAADSEQAKGALLASEDNPVVRLFGRNYRLSTFVLGPLYGLFGVGAWGATLLELSPPDHITLGWVITRFWLPFLVFPFWIAVVIGLPRDWYTKPFLRFIKWYVGIRDRHYNLRPLAK